MPVGKIETGVLKPGMTLKFSPAKLTAEVKSIEMHHQGLETALPGHNVGFNIKNVSVKNLRRGDVAGNAQQDPPSDVSSFEAQVGSAHSCCAWIRAGSTGFLSSGDHPEPPGENPVGLLAGAGLPHSACDLSFRGAEGEAGPAHGEEAGGPAADAAIGRRRHRQDGADQTHVRGELLHVPSFRYSLSRSSPLSLTPAASSPSVPFPRTLCCQRPEADGGRRSHQVGGEKPRVKT